MKMLRVLVYDDEESVGKGFVARLRRLKSVGARLDVADALTNERFRESLAILDERRMAAREGKTLAPTDLDLDDMDVFVVDYDLMKALDSGSGIVGERIAYLARCYSKCGLIVGVNQFGANAFDLTLRGHPESYADLNVGGDELANPNLWGGRKAGLHAWHWPHLPEFAVSFEKRVANARRAMDEPILSTLGFPQEAVAALTRRATQFLVGSLEKEVTQVTFREFADTSGNCLHSKDRTLGDDLLARVAAARVTKWLERLVLPGQDVLVDAPHLVSRFPSLLTRSKSVSDWRTVAAKDRIVGLRKAKIERARFRRNHWLSRPAWFWPLLCSDESIAEVRDPWNSERPDWVFCEDTSTFRARSQCREFVIDSDSVHSRRFAQGDLQGVAYRPMVRFAL